MEHPPELRQVTAARRADEYCLTDRARRDLLINLELLRAWGAINQQTIEINNQKGATQ